MVEPRLFRPPFRSRSESRLDMILEGILTTINVAGEINIAPMGPIVDAEMKRLVLRPYQTSKSFANLQATCLGVFHVVDDVELLAHAAVEDIMTPPAMTRATSIDGWILSDACRWYALRVVTIDAHEPRSRIEVDVVDSGRQRDFFGFNRAKHAVIEAAILATRLSLLPPDEVRREVQRLAPLVDKTGGPRELSAFNFLRDYINNFIRLNFSVIHG